jgi:uncharacterized protein (DUF2237 family)
VLRGATGLLEHEHAPIVLLEMNDDALRRVGTRRDEILEFLRSRGFDFWEVNPRGQLAETDGLGCHDLWCAADGRYAERLRVLVGGNR